MLKVTVISLQSPSPTVPQNRPLHSRWKQMSSHVIVEQNIYISAVLIANVHQHLKSPYAHSSHRIRILTDSIFGAGGITNCKTLHLQFRRSTACFFSIPPETMQTWLPFQRNPVGRVFVISITMQLSDRQIRPLLICTD